MHAMIYLSVAKSDDTRLEKMRLGSPMPILYKKACATWISLAE